MSEQEIRIGVFVCRWGINISGVLDTTADTGLAQYASTLPNVEFAGDYVSYWTTSGADEIKMVVEENQINRIVVAAWTPKTHEPVFKAVLEDAGLDKSYLEFADLFKEYSEKYIHVPIKLRTTAPNSDHYPFHSVGIPSVFLYAMPNREK